MWPLVCFVLELFIFSQNNNTNNNKKRKSKVSKASELGEPLITRDVSSFMTLVICIN